MVEGSGQADGGGGPRVLFEARAAALGGDVDQAGRRLVVYEDRVELLETDGRCSAQMPVPEIDRVSVKRRLSSSTVTLTSSSGVELTLKGIRPGDAGELRQVVAGLHLASAEATMVSTSTAQALLRLEELASIGLLTERELAKKWGELARRANRR